MIILINSSFNKQDFNESMNKFITILDFNFEINIETFSIYKELY